MARRLPAEVLHDSDATPPLIPSCEHIAGRERFMQKALSLQERSDFAFDVTLDLEDGAPAGREAEHARLVAGDYESGAIHSAEFHKHNLLKIS